MTSLPLGMIIEGLVAALLLVTIGYCWLLNRRLQRLRADEQLLRATISELMTATEIAERAILGLKATARDADETLGERLRDAERLSTALAEQVGEGEKIFGRISQIAEAARSAAEERIAAQQAAQAAAHAYPGQRYAPQPQGGQSMGAQPGYAAQGPAQTPYQPAPQHSPVYAQQGYAAQSPAAPVRERASTSEIRSAAAEATERLGRFRNRAGGAAA